MLIFVFGVKVSPRPLSARLDSQGNDDKHELFEVNALDHLSASRHQLFFDAILRSASCCGRKRLKLCSMLPRLMFFMMRLLKRTG